MILTATSLFSRAYIMTACCTYIIYYFNLEKNQGEGIGLDVGGEEGFSSVVGFQDFLGQ